MALTSAAERRVQTCSFGGAGEGDAAGAAVEAEAGDADVEAEEEAGAAAPSGFWQAAAVRRRAARAAQVRDREVRIDCVQGMRRLLLESRRRAGAGPGETVGPRG
jgi:hypothetical protein